jgi:hypothetical protein
MGRLPHFLINGRTPIDLQVVDYRAGQRIRLRVINAAADTAFREAVPGTELDADRRNRGVGRLR